MPRTNQTVIRDVAAFPASFHALAGPVGRRTHLHCYMQLTFRLHHIRTARTGCSQNILELWTKSDLPERHAHSWLAAQPRWYASRAALILTIRHVVCRRARYYTTHHGANTPLLRLGLHGTAKPPPYDRTAYQNTWQQFLSRKLSQLLEIIQPSTLLKTKVQSCCGRLQLGCLQAETAQLFGPKMQRLPRDGSAFCNPP